LARLFVLRLPGVSTDKGANIVKTHSLWPACRPRIIPELVRLARKAELHVHLEGTFESESAFALDPDYFVGLGYPSPADLRLAYSFGCLDDFLKLYYRNCNVLRKPEHFYNLTWAYLQRAHADNVVHVEPFVDPQTHTCRNVPIEDVIVPIHEALNAARTAFGITSNLIPCFVRHESPADAMATYLSAKRFGKMILGFGLDSSEKPFPPQLFEEVFAVLRGDGYLGFAHAGEEGGWQYVEQALDILKVSGIDHGDNSLENIPFARRLAGLRSVDKRRMRLTVCPFSRLRLGGIKSLKQHRIRTMLGLGLFASLHSDDPAYFPGPDGYGGYINDNYIATAEATESTADEVVLLCNNSLEGAFMDETIRREHLDYNDRLLAEYKAAA
jgi:adenosine deaminase